MSELSQNTRKRARLLIVKATYLRNMGKIERIVADGYLWEAKNLMEIARKYENHE